MRFGERAIARAAAARPGLALIALLLGAPTFAAAQAPPPIEFPAEFPVSAGIESRVRHWIGVFSGSRAERERFDRLLGTATPKALAKAPGPAKTRRGSWMRRSLIRSQAYLPTIGETLERHWLPPLLGYLPHVESAFVSTARSRVGAYGLWQIMPATARERGLRVDGSVDERRDPSKASDTAARYLADAYVELGSWPLAITAYNYGIAGMRKAVRSVGSTDLGEIIARYRGAAFGNDVKNFYAKFLAAAHVAENAGYYFPDVDESSVKSLPGDRDPASYAAYWRERGRGRSDRLPSGLSRPADAWPQSGDQALARLAASLVADPSNSEGTLAELRAGGLWADRPSSRAVGYKGSR